MNSLETKDYSHGYKKKIAQRISEIKGKKHLKALFKIIHENNQTYTKDNSGVFFNINTINDNSLSIIEEYLDEHFPIKLPLSIEDKIKSYYSESSTQESSIKLTNQEKNFLRKINTNDDIMIKPFV